MSHVGVDSVKPADARVSIASTTSPPRPRRAERAPTSAGAAHPAVADSLLTTLDAIYDAGAAPGRWPQALAALAACLGGSAATIHAGPAAGPCRITAAFGLGADAARSYGGRCPARDPVVAGAAAKGAAWHVPITARDAAGAGLERSAFFTGWMRPNGIGDLLCLGLLPPGEAHHATIAIGRPPGAPRFGSAETALLWRLAPHLRRAVEMRRRLSSATPAGPLAEALDRLAAAVALLDADGAVVWANRAALLLLRERDGLALGCDGVLRASAPAAAEPLRRLIESAAEGNEGALPAPRPSGRAALALHAVPLSPHGGSEAVPDPVLPAAPPRPCVLLLLSDPERGAPDPALAGRLRAIHGLTDAEATVAARAARGIGLPEVARSLGLSVCTARTHAQRVFGKVGVRGQAELARHVERLSLLRAADRPE